MSSSPSLPAQTPPRQPKRKYSQLSVVFLLAIAGAVLLAIGTLIGGQSRQDLGPGPLVTLMEEEPVNGITADDAFAVHENALIRALDSSDVVCGSRDDCVTEAIRACQYLYEGGDMESLLRPESKAKRERLRYVGDNDVEEFVAAAVGVYCVDKYSDFREATR